MLREVARFVATRGEWTSRGYEIMALLGPDEHKTKVNNQLYENVQAIKVMEAALDILQLLPPGVARPSPRELASWRDIAAHIYLPSKDGVLLPDDSTTDMDAGKHCSSCFSTKCTPGSDANDPTRCPCCSNSFEPGNLAWFWLHGLPQRRVTEAQLNATYSKDVELIQGFGHFCGPSVPTTEAAPFFSTPPFTALAAWSGDRDGALALYRNLETEYTHGPFGIPTEYRARPHRDCSHRNCSAGGSRGSYLTDYGQQLQAVYLGFTGLRVSPSPDPEDWIKHTASLPAGWDTLRVERLTLAGQTCSVIARHGQRATLNCSSATTPRTKTDDSDPVPKSVGWFLGAVHDLNARGQSTFLASTDVADRIMPCCNSLTVHPNGSLFMPWGLPFNGSRYREDQEVLVNLGGQANSVPAMWARKEAFAQEVLALAQEMNVAGFTMDWEFGDVMDWAKWNETMSGVADLLHANGKKLGVCIETGCGDNLPSWAAGTNPPCATLFRNMPWADKLTDMGTYTAGGNTTASRQAALAVKECPSPQNKITKWCGLEGQVLNHLQPQQGTTPPQYSMGTSNGQYSAGLSPNSCTDDSTVAGGWTNETLHEFLQWLDTVGVRSIDIWCGGGVVGGDGGCSTLSSCNSSSSDSECVHGVEAPCRWFLDQITWWRFNEHATGTADGRSAALRTAPGLKTDDASQIDVATSQLPPFSFELGGTLHHSGSLAAGWTVDAAAFAASRSRTRTDFTISGPGDGLQVLVQQTEYGDVAGAREWLLRFRNDGLSPSPPLCNVSPLNTTLSPAVLGTNATVHRFVGSHASPTDYMPVIYPVPGLSSTKPPAPAPGPHGHLVHGPGGVNTMKTGYRLWCHKDCGTTKPTPTAQACQSACAANTACQGVTWVVESKVCYVRL